MIGRFGNVLIEDGYERSIIDIQAGRGRFIERISERKSRWEVLLPNGKTALAIYDKRKKVIGSFKDTVATALENTAR